MRSIEAFLFRQSSLNGQTAGNIQNTRFGDIFIHQRSKRPKNLFMYFLIFSLHMFVIASLQDATLENDESQWSLFLRRITTSRN